MHTGAKQLREWAEASDAQMLIYSLIVFTKRSTHGTALLHADEARYRSYAVTLISPSWLLSRHHDPLAVCPPRKYVEWLVNDSRALTGNHWSTGKAGYIIRSILNQAEVLRRCAQGSCAATESQRPLSL